MAKTYTLTASRYGGTRGASLDPLITTYSGYTTSSNYTGYAGRAYDWQATSFIFKTKEQVFLVMVMWLVPLLVI